MSAEFAFLLRAIEHSPSNHGVTARHLAALIHLSEQRSAIRSCDLATALGIPKPSVTRLMQFLGMLHLTKRRHGVRDGRDCWVEITPEGRELVAKLLPNREQARAA